VNHFPLKESRIHDGKIEARILDGGSAQADWTEVSFEQLSSFVQCNTSVAPAGWSEIWAGRLLEACVGQEPDEMDRHSDHIH
jgi:hypothetical protein